MRTLRTRRLRLLAALLVPIALAACGGGSGSKAVPANAVALVGDEPITQATFASLLAATRRSDQLAGQPFPAAGTAAFRTQRNRLLDQLVQEAEFEQHARSQFGIVIGDEQVQRQLHQLRARTSTGSETLFKRALAQQGLTEALVGARIRRQLLGEAVFARLSADASVSDDDVERYYTSHRLGYERPATRRVSHILVTTRRQADELERKLRNGADFAGLAKRYSIDTATAPAGGVLAGGITKGQSLPEFDRVAFALKTNAISAPVRTENGWHIIEATSDVTPGTTTPLVEVRPTIEAALLTTKRQDALDRWVHDTRKKYAPRVVYAPGFAPLPEAPTTTGQGG
jgi:foldase protein PrsA